MSDEKQKLKVTGLILERKSQDGNGWVKWSYKLELADKKAKTLSIFINDKFPQPVKQKLREMVDEWTKGKIGVFEYTENEKDGKVYANISSISEPGREEYKQEVGEYDEEPIGTKKDFYKDAPDEEVAKMAPPSEWDKAQKTIDNMPPAAKAEMKKAFDSGINKGLVDWDAKDRRIVRQNAMSQAASILNTYHMREKPSSLIQLEATFFDLANKCEQWVYRTEAGFNPSQKEAENHIGEEDPIKRAS